MFIFVTRLKTETAWLQWRLFFSVHAVWHAAVAVLYKSKSCQPEVECRRPLRRCGPWSCALSQPACPLARQQTGSLISDAVQVRCTPPTTTSSSSMSQTRSSSPAVSGVEAGRWGEGEREERWSEARDALVLSPRIAKAFVHSACSPVGRSASFIL